MKIDWATVAAGIDGWSAHGSKHADFAEVGGTFELCSASPVRHGVSVIRPGKRHTLGLVFHDAA